MQPVNWVQRIALYVTPSRYYLIGSNNTQTAFKVLKIDRTVNDLSFLDDGREYDYQEIRKLLICIDHGNLSKANPTGVTKSISSFGLVGFVRFLNGYYLILIVKRRKVASIGFHSIYKIEETKLVYIPNLGPIQYSNEENKYMRAFNRVDLTSNFYFSYSYNISRSLQYNLSPIRVGRFFNTNIRDNSKHYQTISTNEDDAATNVINHNVLVKCQNHDRFVWNSHLIDFEGLHDDWKTYLIHGFVSQANISVYNKPIYITLIARRSRKYCGTRFLKRGCNTEGDAANEVETEQIVHDASVSNFSQGCYTSFVQMRGSLPDRWSQDGSKIVPKPQITRDVVDPYHVTTAKHFDNLLRRYGTPIVVLNLVKQKEKKPRESILSDMLSESIQYLNTFLPQQHMIRLMSFDMARSSKSTNENVMQRLGKIGFNIVRVTGIFQSWRSARRSNYDSTYTLHLRQRSFNRKPSSSRIGGYRLHNGQCVQNGIVRVNCVDSLDRTNTAQFVLGKIALAFQLQALGVLIEPRLQYDTDAVRLLEQLYEDHGDTIAMQYGGSQLVHRVKTYRKVAPITSHSSEIMQTLSRYYSNKFSDSEKQNVINIFLGLKQTLDPFDGLSELLNSLSSDYYLHNELLMKPYNSSDHLGPNRSYRYWWDTELLKSLPRSYIEYEKESTCRELDVSKSSPTFLERIDYFYDAYRPYEFTYFTGLFSIQMLHSVRDLMPNGSLVHSPFCLRLLPGKMHEKYLALPPNKRPPPNPSIFGSPSTASNSSDLSLLESDDEEPGSDLDDLSMHPTAINTSYFMSRNSIAQDSSENYNRFVNLMLDDQSPDADYNMASFELTENQLDFYKSYIDSANLFETQFKTNMTTVGDLEQLVKIPPMPKSQRPFNVQLDQVGLATKYNLYAQQQQEFCYCPVTEADMLCYSDYANSVTTCS